MLMYFAGHVIRSKGTSVFILSSILCCHIYQCMCAYINIHAYFKMTFGHKKGLYIYDSFRSGLMCIYRQWPRQIHVLVYVMFCLFSLLVRLDF